jgi:hypothetical protein
MDYKKNLKEFLAEDATQAFLVLFISFTVLLIFGQLDMNTYSGLMKWGIAGFFGEKITNFRGLK